MKPTSRLALVNCKRCGKQISTLLPIVSDKQRICAECSTVEEKYQILEEQARKKGIKQG